MISFLIVFAPSAIALDEKEDTETIKKALTEFYFGGLKNGDAKLLDQIFHDEFRMMSINNEGILSIVNKQTFLGWYETPRENNSEEWSFEVYSVDVTGHEASAKVRIENKQTKYIDYFNLLKIDGKWWIMHKIYKGFPKE